MRPRLLLTAFEPFGSWSTNASQLCQHALTPLLHPNCDVTTRVYPVEFAEARPLLERDLDQGFDLSLHLGQAQQTSRIRLESLGINAGANPAGSDGESFPLIPGGPAAYQCSLPLGQWATRLRQEGYPAYVSYHAGTYLCNATLYWGLHYLQSQSLPTQMGFVHVPLDISQVVGLAGDYLTLPAPFVAEGLARMISFWLQSQATAELA